LVDDIQAIRQALDGASAAARERTLKILERLTARLALAESERDAAIGEFIMLLPNSSFFLFGSKPNFFVLGLFFVELKIHMEPQYV
jgi:hypothetical protein